MATRRRSFADHFAEKQLSALTLTLSATGMVNRVIHTIGESTGTTWG
ncbi:hypothetical protein ABZ471_09220 [Streptomyces sp. NPDC005728]